MSVAGTRSSQGDEYQLCIALHYLIRILQGDVTELIAECNGIPDEAKVHIDDIVALLPDGTREYVQAKKNQPKHEHWTLKDPVLKKELRNARAQLDTDPAGTVWFYSRSPFGEFRKVVEEGKLSPDYEAFTRNAGVAVKGSLADFAGILGLDARDAFAFLHRINFGTTREFDDWKRQNEHQLARLVPSALTALKILERFLAAHQSRLKGSKFTIQRADILEELASHGIVPAPDYDDQETLSLFEQASQRWRTWPRDIDGTKLEREETGRVLDHIKDGARTILVAAGPGTGKTCLLLDALERLETEGTRGVLFIRGDHFTGVTIEADLQSHGLPSDMVGRCARLAATRPVVVLLDSLDILSTSRNHGALRVFLGLLACLEKLKDVTVVAACRTFDLKYEPQLRAKSWQRQVSLPPLDFDALVAPLLTQWGVDPDSLGEATREVLRTPTHLRMYFQLLGSTNAPRAVSRFELYECFIEETVTRRPELGDGVLRSLQNLATQAFDERRQNFPRASVDLTSDTIQRLLSSAVLTEVGAGTFAFGHQTIAEALAVQAALRAQQTLAGFILQRPPLLFTRPTVRAFFFFLHSHDRNAFRRQVRNVLDHEDIAYHLKRLVVESLVETSPGDEDWRLVRHIFDAEPTLFQRILVQAANDAWFALLRDQWLPLIRQSPEHAPWRRQYLGALARWLPSRVDDVVRLWTDALAHGWAEGCAWTITSGLSKLSNWKVEGLAELFKLLVAKEEDAALLCKPLSAWIASTDAGDELMWQLLRRRTADGDEERLVDCTPDAFHDVNFLANRLRRSDYLLSRAVEHLETLYEKTSPGMLLGTGCLYKTSWERNHSNLQAHAVDDLSVLTEGVEQALRYRATHNDAWWREHEPRLRLSQDLGIRFMLCLAYRRNPAANVLGIEAQLTDAALRGGHLDYELGELTVETYADLSSEAQDRHQALLLTLYDDQRAEDGALPDWCSKDVYYSALWIPRCFRGPLVVDLIENWVDECGVFRREPEPHLMDFSPTEPISRADMANLDDHAIVSLLQHYGADGSQRGRFLHDLSGLRRSIRDCASSHPRRFLSLLCELDADTRGCFEDDILDGVATHLRYVAGTWAPPDWWTCDAPPDPESLAGTLLRRVEFGVAGCKVLDQEAEHATVHILKAVAGTTVDQETIERTTLSLWRFVNSSSPETSTKQDLDSVSLNSVRGIAAGAAMSLYCQCLEHDIPAPRLLGPLLRRFARDPVEGVTVSILQSLPFLLFHQPDLGWELFDDVFREPRTKLWQEAERVLYRQYYKHFDVVRPLLERMRSEALEEAGEAYGRIVTLCFLAGHPVTGGKPLTTVLKSDGVLRGAAQVLTANLADRSVGAKCKAALIEMLATPACAPAAVAAMSRLLGQEKDNAAIDPELVRLFVDALPQTGNKPPTFGLLQWLEKNCARHPLLALDICEQLVALRTDHENLRLSSSMVPVLLEILGEADESGDPVLIARAIKLQDEFLRLGVHGVDDLLDGAAVA